MKFTEALREMKEGKKVKLPSWGGYWYWDKEKTDSNDSVQTTGL